MTTVQNRVCRDRQMSRLLPPHRPCSTHIPSPKHSQPTFNCHHLRFFA